MVGMSWRSIMDTNVEAKALNLLGSYLSVARSYAMANQIETVLTVEPNEGQIEIFAWAGWPTNDPNREGDLIQPNWWYAYVPLVDETARLPKRGKGLAVRIAPIDCFETSVDLEAFARFAVCFDPKGKLVVRDLTAVYAPYPLRARPYGGRIVGLMPGFLTVPPPPRDGNLDWHHITTSLGGMLYEPPEGLDTPGGAADPRDRRIMQKALNIRPFLLNPYTGQLVREGK